MRSDLQASLKLWDVRMFGDAAVAPVLAWKDASLFNYNQQTNVALSSNERIVLTGSSVRKGRGEKAPLIGFDTTTGDSVCLEHLL